MPNNRFNKQVTPKGYKLGGKVKGEAKVKAIYESVRDKNQPMKLQRMKDRFRVKKKMGGSLKPVDPKTQKGLSKLPTKVRNKMGYMQDGGKVMKKASLNVGETLKQFKDLMTGSKDSKMSKQKENLKKQIAEAKAQTRDRAKVKNKKG